MLVRWPSHVVVSDHSPSPACAFRAAEEEQVRGSSEAMERFGIRRRETFRTEQTFRDYAEFLAMLSSQRPCGNRAHIGIRLGTAITIAID
jgi:hypothetical protein